MATPTLMRLTIAYLTNRVNPRLEWFFDSLRRETKGDFHGIKVVVVDFFRNERIPTGVTEMRPCFGNLPVSGHAGGKYGVDFQWVAPMPSVWQGPHRLTTQDYFAASNARNTALCYAPDGWIAYVDDLSVLLPGWLEAVRRGMDDGYIVLGAYKKVKQLVVSDGEVVSFEPFEAGVDSRWPSGHDAEAVRAAGSWMYGCSLAAPVEAFMRINGWDTDCDSMGSEDYVCGMMIQRCGYSFKYDRRMLTFESEEAHGEDKPFLRIIKKMPGSSAKDASHWMLNAVMAGRDRAPNYFGPGGIRELRARILSGESFPITQIPAHHWPDGQPLAEM